MGAGHINIADALAASAIMVAPTRLLVDPNPLASGVQREFNPPTNDPPPAGDFDAAGNLRVLIPTVSYGAVPVVRLNDTIVRTQEVIIRDVMGGSSGVYNLSLQDNRSASSPGFDISFTDAAGAPISSVAVPSGGEVSFTVRVAADGTRILADPTEFQWFVTATQTSTGKALRMPFYFRAVTAIFPNSAAPDLLPPTETEPPSPAPSPAPMVPAGCVEDANGNYTLNYTYTTPELLRFRAQEATESTELFFDNADERLTPNAIGTTVVTENKTWRDLGIPGTPPSPPSGLLRSTRTLAVWPTSSRRRRRKTIR